MAFAPNQGWSLPRIQSSCLHVPKEKDEQHQSVDRQPVRPKTQRPKKVYSAQEPQQQRRIAHRREQATAIGYYKDKKYWYMMIVFTVMIGSQERTNQQHARSGGADHVGQHCPQGQPKHVA